MTESLSDRRPGKVLLTYLSIVLTIHCRVNSIGEINKRYFSQIHMQSDWWNYIERFERSIFSQNGEDGVIEFILDQIGVESKQCVEIGVEDGVQCNTRYLIQEKGFDGLMIDASTTPGHEMIKQEWITTENVNQVFGKYEIPKKFDLLSIDIDGNDYWVWRALQYYPRVIVIEYNASVPPDESRAIPYDADFRWDGTDYFGASLLALQRLGRHKGYTLL